MGFKLLILSLVVVAEVLNVNAGISPATMFIKQKAEEALQVQILKAKSDIRSCHDHYSEVLKTLLEAYDGSAKQCEDNENDKLLELANEEQPSRDAATESLTKACTDLKECEDKSENLEFFDCVNDSGDSSTRAVWKASRDSSESAAIIREKIHAIQFKTDECKREAERVYIVGTTKATDEMMACYANGGMPEPEN